jgi:hypothetical protein
MSELRLDYQPNPPIPRAGAALLALAIIALILTATYYLKLSSQVASWEAKLERSQDGMLSGRSAKRGTTELAQEVNNANEVLRQLSVPWEELFQALELAGGNTVTLLALEPNVESRQVKISGESKNFKALMNYLTRLQEQPVFGSIYIQSHQVQVRTSDKPVHFSILATWREKP